MIHLDTHVAVWLFAGEVDRFPRGARSRLEADTLAISPMVELELEYLHEIGRTRKSGAAVVAELERSIGLMVDSTPFAAVVGRAAKLSWTRDPFDRLIVAQSLAAGVKLLTKDEVLRRHSRVAVWD